MIIPFSNQKYAAFYEQSICRIQQDFIQATKVADCSKQSLLDVLKAKRDFGLEKYKDKSFQSSILNSLNTPILQHTVEELVDLINYLSHITFLLSIMDENASVISLRAQNRKFLEEAVLFFFRFQSFSTFFSASFNQFAKMAVEIVKEEK